MNKEVTGYEYLVLKIFNFIERKDLLPIDENMVACLEKALSKAVSPREEKVLRQRCGIGENTRHTLEKVGIDFGVSKENIRNIEQKSLRKLRAWFRKRESRFIRGEKGNIIAFVEFFPAEAKKLLVGQQQELEELSAKYKRLAEKFFTLAGKYQDAIGFIEELNTPNKNLAKIAADLVKIEDGLKVIESLDEMIENLAKLKTGYPKLQRDIQTLKEQIKPPGDKKFLASPLNLKEFMAQACQIIPNANEPIEMLEFSVRTSHCLEIAGIETVGQLVQKTEADLLKIKNFGRKSLNEVKEVLKIFGWRLGMKFPEDLIEKL